jgi:D-amino peptidase
VDVLISVDLEGVAGIATRQQIGPGGRDYPAARELMTAEANAAVAGAFEGGATSVVVNDSHGPARDLLDRRADYVIGEPAQRGMTGGAAVRRSCRVAGGLARTPSAAAGSPTSG